VSGYRKFIAAALTAAAGFVTTWQTTGDLETALASLAVGVLGAAAVWAVPNEETY
jgi:hypothetical protein